MAAKKSKSKTPTKVKKSAPAKAAAKKPAAAPKKAAAPARPSPAARPAAVKKPAEAVAPAPAKPASRPAGAKKEVIAEGVRKTPLPPPREDGEGGDNSLLAGPRNVQPYVAKRGEVYMSKDQLEHFRHILLNWKQDLMLEVDRTVSHMKDEAANFPDPNDRATQEEEFSLELRTRDRERKLIRKIDEALKRIEDGSYGYCLETGEQIGIKRLEARPVATLSIEAQERRERREKQYGDRDDRYR